ncbi:type II toxin-antitoxin system HigB family toxin [bacterium]|nr:type II toxin-antitoxin system HigB family toxin [bacterium]QQR57036.1 MAG: type II toxin-antitoxin system HigB family toxin [Candidatus Melainabacteria bacterium]
MEIVNIEVLHKFAWKNSELRNTANAWSSIVSDSEWSHRKDVIKSFPRADFNSRHGAYIFNLGGNFRLIAQITFSAGVVEILDILNHSEYMKWSNRG